MKPWPPSPAAQGPSWWSAPGAVNGRGCHWDRSSATGLESTKPGLLGGEATAETLHMLGIMGISKIF